MSNPEDIIYIPLLKDFFWSTLNAGFGIGEEISNQDTYKYASISEYPSTLTHEGIYTIIDTGMGAIYISNIYFDDIIFRIYEKMEVGDYTLESGYVLT